MNKRLWTLRSALLKLIFFVLYHGRALRPTNRIVNKFQLQRRDAAQQRNKFPFIEKRISRNVQILVYHRVNDERDPFFPGTPTVSFAKQMEFLAANFYVCSVAEAVDRLRTGDVPENAVVVTFDDGYRDNYLHAFPILKRFSIPATVFLATAVIGTGNALWHDRVFSAFRTTEIPILRGFGNVPKSYPLRTVTEKLTAQTAVLEYLRSIPDQDRTDWINYLTEQLNTRDGNRSSDLMLTWEDVRTMHRYGIDFGSHTVTHPILSRVSAETATYEIQESKRAIERHLESRVTGFAYPSGRREDFSDEVKAMVREAGYTCGLTMVFGANERGQDPFGLRRGGPWESDAPTFAAKLLWYKFIS